MALVTVIVSGLCCLFLSFPVQAEPHTSKPSGVKIVGFPKEGRIEADGTGPFAELVNAILQQAGFSERITMMPIRRAIRSLGDGESLCIVPISVDAFASHFPSINPGDLIGSRPIDYVTGHLVTLPNTKPITSPLELKGKTIASWVGINPRLALPDFEYTLLQAETEISAIRMLQSGRAQAIWGWVPDSHILFQREGLGEPVYDRNLFFTAGFTQLGCTITAETKYFLQRVNTVIDVMRMDGRLKAYLSEHARIVGVDVPEDMPTAY